jgi:hypothetical protein
MKKLVVSCLAVLTMLPVAFAQDQSDLKAEMKAEMKAQRDALKQERQNGPQPNAGAASLAAVTAGSVGEPDSFGRNALFLGIAQSGTVVIDPTCDPVDIGPLGPDDHCITVADPSIPVPATTFNDVARITIPGKSAGNVIYAIANHTVSFSMFNPGAPTQGRISYVPTITIESDALKDPSLIDPTTGLPFNGSFTVGGAGAYLVNKTLASGASEFVTHSYSRANTSGLSRSFFAGLGLPDSAINELYKKPMTIRLNVRVSSRWVDSAVLVFTMRFLGN